MKKTKYLSLLTVLLALSACNFNQSNGNQNNNSNNQSQSGENNGGPKNNAVVEKIKNVNLSVDPVKYVLSENQNKANRRNSVKGEDNDEYFNIRREEDSLGGKYEEKEDYCTWTNLADSYGDVRDRIVSLCEGFDDPLQSFNDIKNSLPDDLETGVITKNSSDIIYLNEEDGVTTFYQAYEDEGEIQNPTSFTIEELENGKTKYSYTFYSECLTADYMRIEFSPVEGETWENLWIGWDEIDQKYYYYNFNVESGFIRAINSDYVFPLVIEENSKSLISYDQSTKKFTKLADGEIDFFLFDNGDGSLTMKAREATGSHTKEEMEMANQRWKTNKIFNYISWIEDEDYESISIPLVPTYAMGAMITGTWLFKAYRDADNYWRVFRTLGFAANDCLGVQNENGWYMVYDYGRDPFNGKIMTESVKMADSSARDIGVYFSNMMCATFNLNNLDGWDEIRAEKENVELQPFGTFNDEIVDTYYSASKADLYRDGERIFQSVGSYQETETTTKTFIRVEALLDFKAINEKTQNYNNYVGELIFFSNDTTVSFTAEYLASVFEQAGLTLKGGNTVTGCLADAARYCSNLNNLLSEFDFHGLLNELTSDQFANKLVKEIYPLLDATPKIKELLSAKDSAEETNN